MVLGHQKDIVLVWVIDNFIQPDDIGMLQPLKNLKFFNDVIVSCLSHSLALLFEIAFTHLFDG